MNKEQLDKIWNSTEIGWLQRHNKNSRKKESRKLRVTFYEKVTKHVLEDTVYVGKNDSAMSLAWVVVKNHYPTTKDMPSGNYEARFVND
jgi:hypothetical protein